MLSWSENMQSTCFHRCEICTDMRTCAFAAWKHMCKLKINVSAERVKTITENPLEKLPESKRFAAPLFMITSMWKSLSDSSHWTSPADLSSPHTHLTFVSMVLKTKEQLRFDAVLLLLSMCLLWIENPGKHTHIWIWAARQTIRNRHRKSCHHVILDCDWSVVSFWALNCVQHSTLPSYVK